MRRMKMSSKTLTPPSPFPRKALAAVLDLCRKLNAERNFPELLKVLSQEAAKILQAESTSILIYDREHCELVSFVTLDGVPIRLDARLGIAGAALMNGIMRFFQLFSSPFLRDSRKCASSEVIPYLFIKQWGCQH